MTEENKAQETEDDPLKEVFESLQNPTVEVLAGHVANLLYTATRDSVDIICLKGTIIALVKELVAKGVLDEAEFDKKCQDEIMAVNAAQLEEAQRLTEALDES